MTRQPGNTIPILKACLESPSRFLSHSENRCYMPHSQGSVFFVTLVITASPNRLPETKKSDRLDYPDDVSIIAIRAIRGAEILRGRSSKGRPVLDVASDGLSIRMLGKATDEGMEDSVQECVVRSIRPWVSEPFC
ncbi:hypothetical protein M413DRAFT_444249 [Hebeloma cylindrosporum]|uniref:Uncharacterized protein n=1 Tax=Hebeloma cylindrosporum TaxID=76867 RepID=A0A0C2XXX9_HEBCY|nr:hypothetical protein M413DRAFT_444249 [Hebeloma cylindrosporum h7]